MTEEGTFLNVENLLKDTTAALLGGNANMVPNDAFVALKNLIDSISPDDIGAAKIAAGIRSGTGSASFMIMTGFKPKAAIICQNNVSLYANGGQAAANVSGIAVWIDGVGSVDLGAPVNAVGDRSVSFFSNQDNLSCSCGQYAISMLNGSADTYSYAIFG